MIKLSMSQIEAYRGPGLPSGKYIRFFCPIHAGDNQRSFQLNPESGHFKCYTCGKWGYLVEVDEKRKQVWLDEKSQARSTNILQPRTLPITFSAPEPKPVPELELIQVELEKNLPGSLGERYLEYRRISLEVGKKFGIGYAPEGSWPHYKDGKPVRQWRDGRLTCPHSNPSADVVNLYGRAVAKSDNPNLPKQLKHDHLPGSRGMFNALALWGDANDTVYITEGMFDALAMMSAGYSSTCAIFGLSGLRWNWVKARNVVLCLDQDDAGQAWQKLAWDGSVLGKKMYWLSPKTYGAYKDLAEVWQATGQIDIGEWE